MAETRKHLAVKLFIVSCLAAGLCKGLTSTVNEEPAPRTSSKNAPGPATSKHVTMRAAWKRGYNGIQPPKHVMKLMQRLSHDRNPFKEHGNMIRSYLPTLSFACMEPTYVFSMRQHRSENLQALYLHFYAPKPNIAIASRLTIDIHTHVIANTSSPCQSVGVRQRPAGAHGWQVVDLTSQISHFINTSTVSDPSKITLGISFRIQATAGSHGKSRGRGITEKMVSNHARPFLLMYAEEDESNGKNDVLPWTEEGSMHSTPDASKTPEKLVHSRHTRSVDNKAQSVMTNEFPESSVNLAHHATFQQFTQQDSKRRKSKHSKRRKGASRRHGKALLVDQSSSARDEEPLPSRGTNGDHNIVLSEDPSHGACSRHPMFVGFDTIDWDKYVIAPTGFDAFYCAGNCSFPLYKTGNPSNHATIQSVMSVAGVQPKIPPPCCVPETLSPITILFFDEDGNLKLKTYQNMVVESCGCR